jgi:L-ribulose-5-phosphate 3-epimerase
MNAPSKFCNALGVMQGRLLPKYQDRYQAHPVGYWQDEFELASQFELDCIEFILDFNDADQNPLLTDHGIDEILSVSTTTGVGVSSVCADYFMEAPLHHTNEDIARQSQEVLLCLLAFGQKLKLSDIVIPCVDQSSLAGDAAKERLVKRLMPIVEKAEKVSINLSLETDLPPQPFAELLTRFDSERVTVNYDTGNSASLGFDPLEELACYGSRISDIHIKDRIRDGGSVILDTGDTQFERFFDALGPFQFSGPFILQAFRDDEGVDIFDRQLKWLRSHFL